MLIIPGILNEPMRRPVVTLFIISAADMMLTIIGLMTGRIGEFNPIMNYILICGGIPLFFAAKSLTILLACLVLTYAGIKDPRIADRYGWCSVWIYLVVFTLGIVAQL
jgi:hypothetical protein